jgi:sporulation protein YunB
MRRRRFGRRVRVLLALSLPVLLCVLTLRWADARLGGQLHALAAMQAASTQEHAMADAVLNALSGVKSDSLVHIFQNDAGQIVSVQTDALEVNRLKGRIALAATGALTDGGQTVRIPVGSLTGLDILAGRGPGVAVRVQTAGYASAQIRSAFTGAGINQTVHRLTLDVTAVLTISMPHYIQKQALHYDVCIAETIIVGETPDVYAGLNNGE